MCQEAQAVCFHWASDPNDSLLSSLFHVEHMDSQEAQTDNVPRGTPIPFLFWEIPVPEKVPKFSTTSAWLPDFLEIPNFTRKLFPIKRLPPPLFRTLDVLSTARPLSPQTLLLPSAAPSHYS
jgi:hypothetical protein